MLRLFVYLAVIALLAVGLSWLADRPGQLVINWEGRVIETSVFYAVVLLSALLGAVLFVWSILRHIWESPAAIGSFLSRRREKRGLDSLSSGMIAIGAGDRSGATKYAIQARKSMPNEPLTHLLRAQAAQLSGDKATARRIYEGMLNTPDTEALGLRGLFLEAQQEGELEAARQFAERAVRLNPKLKWPVDSLFELQCKAGDWAGALETVQVSRKNGHIEKASAERRRAVLLTAQAQAAEDNDPERALKLATEAHQLAPGLVPAAAIAGRLLASRGNTPKATKVIQKTWQKSPHPDLAVAYAYSRLGDSPRDRLERVKKLAALNPYSPESPIAVATAAIDAKDYDEARAALEPMLENRLTQRICTLMARIEGEELGDKGRVREWLARAVNAPRDPAWTADGVVSEQWAPVSPVTGALDAFQWRVPVESAEKTEADLIAKKLEELVALGAPAAAVGHAATDAPAETAAKAGELPDGISHMPGRDGKGAEDAVTVDVDNGAIRAEGQTAARGGVASAAVASAVTSDTRAVTNNANADEATPTKPVDTQSTTPTPVKTDSTSAARAISAGGQMMAVATTSKALADGAASVSSATTTDRQDRNDQAAAPTVATATATPVTATPAGVSGATSTPAAVVVSGAAAGSGSGLGPGSGSGSGPLPISPSELNRAVTSSSQTSGASGDRASVPAGTGNGSGGQSGAGTSSKSREASSKMFLSQRQPDDPGVGGSNLDSRGSGKRKSTVPSST